MVQEVAKPIALALCMLSLFAVFYTALMVPASDLEQKIWDSLVLLSLAAGICLSSGMLFREPAELGFDSVRRTLPVQMFCWAVGVIVILFVVSWYLETYCIFFKDVRRW